MGFLSKLKEIDSTINSVSAKKDELKKSVNKSEWSDEDRKNNKKSLIRSTLNLIGVIILAVAVPLVLPQVFDADSGTMLWVLIIGGGLAIGLFGSINMTIKFNKNKVISLGAKVYAFLVLALLIAALILDGCLLMFDII